MLDGTNLGGGTLAVQLDQRSKDATKIQVRGVPANLDWGTLKSHFERCGKVEYANVIKSVDTPSRLGEARFHTAEDAQEALSLSGSVLAGNEIDVKMHSGSKDATKVQIFNLPSNLEWQELKEFLLQAGLTPIFVDISAPAPGSMSAEVRYDDPEHARIAMEQMNGSIFGGGQLFVKADERSPDGAKLFVTGIPSGTEWQELKDHFGTVGSVAFVKTNDQLGKGKGKGQGKGKDMHMMGIPFMMNMMSNPMMGMGGGCWGSGWGGGFGKGGCWDGSGGKGGMGGMAGMGPQGLTGEIRYDAPMHAQMAAQMLNGSVLRGAMLAVGLDLQSQDGSKLWVAGISPGTSWKELKDHFAYVGQVAFASVK
mmetsp:Transcript_148588/g.386345  ORF Transcript_148588/g.386345 Transcript_148588/m.386345 type:complete len:366 (+) Transcript_148588:871-1968(+)